MTGKPLLIGETNPYGSAPEFALYPLPKGCSGWRLCRLVMGLEMRQYLRAYDRANLLTGKWSLPAARYSARQILLSSSAPAFILCGAKVAAAFGLAFEPFSLLRRETPAMRAADPDAPSENPLRSDHERLFWCYHCHRERVFLGDTCIACSAALDHRLREAAFVILSHPSGLSRGWNAPGAYERAREVLRGAGCLVAPETAKA